MRKLTARVLVSLFLLISMHSLWSTPEANSQAITSTTSTSLTLTSTSTQQMTATSTVTPYAGDFVIAAPSYGSCRYHPLGYNLQKGVMIRFVVRSSIPIDVFIMSANEYSQWRNQQRCAPGSYQWGQSRITAYVLPDPIEVVQGGDYYFLFLNYDSYHDASVTFVLEASYVVVEATTTTLTHTSTVISLSTITGLQALLGSLGGMSQNELMIVVGAVVIVILLVVLMMGRRR